MKKAMLILLVAVAVISKSQTVNYTSVDSLNGYVKVTVRNRVLSNKVNVYIDYGQKVGIWQYKSDKRDLLDNKENRILFNSTTEVLNYFTCRGYELVSLTRKTYLFKK